MTVIELQSLKKVITVDKSSCDESVYDHEFEIRRISGDESYGVIFEKYILKNVPFVLSIAQSNWKCLKKWIVCGKPDFDLLKNEFGSAVVPVANCGVRYFNAQEKENMLLKDFLDYWKEYICNQYPSDMRCLYLKDWHFTRDFPHNNVYIVPKYFSSDWLNEYLTSKDGSDDERCIVKDDYRFVYMGPKGTWTPFHADVFSSFSWSANICGKKKWLLFPPGEENRVKDKFGNLVYDVESEELKNSHLYPEYSDTIKCYELVQGPGEAVFVPSGWHHQVWNLEDTISINHNWINGCNINVMWQALRQNLISVKKEIADCQSMDGWVNHCQLMLKASFGIDFSEFYKFIKFIADKRISLINNNKQLIMYGGWKLGKVHAVFDLVKINEILCDIISDDDCNSLEFFQERFSLIKLFIKEINAILEL